MKVVRVATGYSNVALPDGRVYNSGPLISLTDDQYNLITDLIKRQLVVVRSTSDTAPPQLPANPSYAAGLIYDLLATMGVPLFFIWDGVDYQPSSYKSATDRPKTFIGPTDPHGFVGVNLALRDQWINA